MKYDIQFTNQFKKGFEACKSTVYKGLHRVGI